MPPWMLTTMLLIGSYFLGSIPFGLIVVKWVAGVDIREHGSGNIGSTNVYRVAGRTTGVGVFILDVLKGLIPPLAVHFLHTNAALEVSAGFCAIMGHSFSPFLGFKGGKGVATSLGVLFGVAWKVGVTAWSLWFVVLFLFRYVSLASIAAAVSLTPLTIYFYHGDWWRLGLTSIAAILSLWRHRSNMIRLLNGTESRIGKKKEEPS